MTSIQHSPTLQLSSAHAQTGPDTDNFGHSIWRLAFALVPSLIKKRPKFSSYIWCKEIQMGSGAKSYMRKGILIYCMRKCATISPYRRRPLVIYVRLCNRSLLNFLIKVRGKFDFPFYFPIYVIYSNTLVHSSPHLPVYCMGRWVRLHCFFTNGNIQYDTTFYA